MSSRDKILNDIKSNQPEYTPLQSWAWAANDQEVETFMRSLKGIGGNVMIAAGSESIERDIIQTHGKDKRIVNTTSLLSWSGLDDIAQDFPGGPASRETKDSMEQVEVAIIEGQLGVAENGAVWIDEGSINHRVLPFICQHLVIILHEQSIVANMHQAYSRIDVSKPGFGVFIAGPSKTADIEQSLVIGAHGARSLTVYITRG